MLVKYHDNLVVKSKKICTFPRLPTYLMAKKYEKALAVLSKWPCLDFSWDAKIFIRFYTGSRVLSRSIMHCMCIVCVQPACTRWAHITIYWRFATILFSPFCSLTLSAQRSCTCVILLFGLLFLIVSLVSCFSWHLASTCRYIIYSLNVAYSESHFLLVSTMVAASAKRHCQTLRNNIWLSLWSVHVDW